MLNREPVDDGEHERADCVPIGDVTQVEGFVDECSDRDLGVSVVVGQLCAEIAITLGVGNGFEKGGKQGGAATNDPAPTTTQVPTDHARPNAPNASSKALTTTVVPQVLAPTTVPAAVAPPAPAEAELPELGVYRYATSGHESVSVPGSGRDFPEETAITITDSDCGVLETWQPFEEHEEHNLVCPDGPNTRLAAFESDIVFYGQTDREEFTCDPAASFGSADLQSGQRWSFTCSAETTTAESHATLVGHEQLTVADTVVDSVHVRVDTTLTGHEQGNSTNDYWFRTSDTLLIKNTGTIHSRSSGSFGSTDYTETYDLLLTSLTPAR